LAATDISAQAQSRAAEALGPDEEIKKGKRWMGGKRYLVTWRVVKATKWTA
jgi:hypothetical protein